MCVRVRVGVRVSVVVARDKLYTESGGEYILHNPEWMMKKIVLVFFLLLLLLVSGWK